MEHTSGHARPPHATTRLRVARVATLGLALTLGAGLAALATPPAVPTPAAAEPASHSLFEVTHSPAPAAVSAKPKVRTRTIEVGDRPRIEGKLPGPRGRKVTLSVQPPDTYGFKRIDTSRLDRRGIYLFKPRAATKAGRFVYKVAVKRDGVLKATARKFVVKVTDPDDETVTLIENPVPPVDPTPKGDPNDWTHLLAGKPVRWDPCTPITWHYDGALAPYAAAEADANAAIASVAARTGHTFTRVPTAAEAVFHVSWSTPALTPNLDGPTIGRGGFTYYSVDPATNNGSLGRAANGVVVLDATANGAPGFGPSPTWTWGQVYTHEVMHALGLGHASGIEQVMHGTASKHNQAYGAGDLTGLAQIGSAQGCMPPMPWMTRTAKQRVGTVTWSE